MFEIPMPPDDPSQILVFPVEEKAPAAVGALVKMKDAPPGIGGTLIYFSSENCAIEEGRVEEAGGKISRPKFSIGTIALSLFV